jgi:hypothetical protein
MGKFKVGDRISHIRKDLRVPEILCTGIVEKGPFIVDDIDHYQIIWEGNHTLQPFSLICDLPSTKYEYIKSSFKFLK